jgi:hypothetical protein
MSEWVAWVIMGGLVAFGILCMWWSNRAPGTKNVEDAWATGRTDHDIEAARAQAWAHNTSNGDGIGGIG